MRILIAEDEFIPRTALTEVLESYGHEVIATINGAEALVAMQQSDAPRLAILDWMMPEMEGLDVCRHIRAMETDQPPYLIMLTIKGKKTDIITGLEAGANDYLSKPFDPGELLARVEVGRRMVDLQAKLFNRVQELNKALSDVKLLSGLIPICSFCKEIRDDKGYWNQLEQYITDHSEALFSHGICPKCMKKHYPDFYADGDVTSKKKNK